MERKVGVTLVGELLHTLHRLNKMEAGQNGNLVLQKPYNLLSLFTYTYRYLMVGTRAVSGGLRGRINKTQDLCIQDPN